MFDDVPQKLTTAVRDLPRDQEPHVREVMAAAFVVVHYLGLGVVDAVKKELSPEYYAGDFGKSYKFHIWIQLVANNLLYLRNEPGFSEICRRLSTRDLQSTFFESYAAFIFKKAGFAIEAKAETLVKASDFDFSALSSAFKINVEVTKITVPDFQENTLDNTLRAKRKQLPSDSPAVIVIAYPGTWFELGTDIVPSLRGVVDRFFNGTKRINALLFVGVYEKEHNATEGLGSLSLTQLACWNGDVRHPVNLSWMNNRSGPVGAAMSMSFEAMEEASKSELGPSVFKEWYEWCGR